MGMNQAESAGELQPFQSAYLSRSCLDQKRTDRMRVVFVSLRGEGGGSNVSLLTLLGYMPPKVLRILACPRGRLASSGLAKGMVDEFVPLDKTFRHPQLRRFAMAVQLARWLRTQRHRVDAVHANGLSEMHVALPGALLAGVPLVVVARWGRGSAWLHASAPVYRLARGRVVFTAVSASAQEVVAKARVASRDSITVVGNPICPSEAVADTRPLGPPWVIGYLGSDSPSKGIDLLGPAIRATANSAVRWRIFMAEPNDSSSSPGMQDVLRLTGSDNYHVSFAGRASPVRIAYGDCHIVFVPSAYESFCRVAAEAALNGRIIVVSDLPATREVLDGYDNAWFFSPGNEASCREALASAIAALERDECVEAVPLTLRSRVDGNAIARRLSAVYGGLSSTEPLY